MASVTENIGESVNQFWSDFMSRVGGTSSGAASAEGAKQMQRMFLDALAKYCDDFMRSEQFLSMMRQTMDRSLAFKQQVDSFLTNAYKSVQAPSRNDTTELSALLRGVEDRVLGRLDQFEQRVAAVEESRPGRARAKASRPAHSPSRAKTSAKSKPAKAAKKKRSR